MNPEGDLLGCILAGADPTDLDLVPGDFADPRNEAVFRACVAVADTGRRCDPQSVAMEMGSLADRLPTGRLHLIELASQALPMNAPAFALQVRQGAVRRALVSVGQSLIQKAEQGEDPAMILADAREDLDKRATPSRKATVSLPDLLPDFIDRVQTGGDPGLSTPWADVDRHLHGLHPGRLYTIGGRPGAGKSVVLTNLATHFADHHKTGVLFATLEMPADELLTRIVSATAGVAQTNLMTSQASEADWDRIRRAYTQLEGMGIEICDDGSQSLQSLRTAARDLKRRGRLGLIVVDYLQLLTPQDRRLTRQQQIGELTRGLKRLAKELGVPVVTASQLRRPADAKNPRPTMSDLRESGDIEADSDVIILLHCEDPDQPWNLEAMVAKNRSGSRGPVQLMFDTTRASIRNAA